MDQIALYILQEPRLEPPQRSTGPSFRSLVLFMADDPDQKKPRLGVAFSVGEGAWRLVPLSEEQALTCHVPFTSADLGEGVWRTLT